MSHLIRWGPCIALREGRGITTRGRRRVCLVARRDGPPRLPPGSTPAALGYVTTAVDTDGNAMMLQAIEQRIDQRLLVEQSYQSADRGL